MFNVATVNYSGPLEKLLELIEAQKLDITRISLAQVTGDFLAYVETLQKKRAVEPKILADFIATAAKLILIKSKILLPNLKLASDEEEEIKTLESRLILYKQLKNVGIALRSITKKDEIIYAREYLKSIGPIFYPSQTITVATLDGTIKKILGAIAQVRDVKETKSVARELRNLEDTMQELLQQLNTTTTSSLTKMFAGKERNEIVLLFLAVLHLIKLQHVTLQNHETEGTMIVKSI